MLTEMVKINLHQTLKIFQNYESKVTATLCKEKPSLKKPKETKTNKTKTAICSLTKH